MSDEKMNEIVARYLKALPERIRAYIQGRSKSILIICKREFGRFVLGSKGIPAVSSIGGGTVKRMANQKVINCL